MPNVADRFPGGFLFQLHHKSARDPPHPADGQVGCGLPQVSGQALDVVGPVSLLEGDLVVVDDDASHANEGPFL